MDVLYLEGAGPDVEHGLVFHSVGDGWLVPLLVDNTFAFITPGRSEIRPIVTSDVRKAKVVLTTAFLDGLEVVSLDEIVNRDLELSSYVEAGKKSGIAVDSMSALLFVPGQLATKEFAARKELAESLLCDRQSMVVRVNLTVAKLVLLEAEQRGFVWEGKIIHPKFNFDLTKTERFGTETGFFRCMSIGRSTRHKLTARPGHSIIVFDFNAIDGRSIVSMHESAVSQFGQSIDLYADMFKHVFDSDPDDELRAFFKLQFFRHAYGAGENLRPADEAIRQMIMGRMPWLAELREQTHLGSIEHIGKDLAIEAQRQSSRTFCAALKTAAPYMMGSYSWVHPLFTVHDELVVEVVTERNDEAVSVMTLALESGAYSMAGVEHRVKHKIGQNYGECK